MEGRDGWRGLGSHGESKPPPLKGKGGAPSRLLLGARQIAEFNLREWPGGRKASPSSRKALRRDDNLEPKTNATWEARCRADPFAPLRARSIHSGWLRARRRYIQTTCEAAPGDWVRTESQHPTLEEQGWGTLPRNARPRVGEGYGASQSRAKISSVLVSPRMSGESSGAIPDHVPNMPAKKRMPFKLTSFSMW